VRADGKKGGGKKGPSGRSRQVTSYRNLPPRGGKKRNQHKRPQKTDKAPSKLHHSESKKKKLGLVLHGKAIQSPGKENSRIAGAVSQRKDRNG